MDIKRALNIRNVATGAVIDIFSRAQHYSLPHARMLEERAQAYERLGVHKAPRWVGAFLDGYWQACQRQLYRDALVYGAMIDGRFYSVHCDRPDYYEKHGIEPSAFAADNPTKGHYWGETYKPFFTSPD